MRILLASLLLAACQDDGRLAFNILPTCFKVETTTERVFRTNEKWQAFASSQRSPFPPPAVDFATSMVAAHFDGWGSACVRFSVESVEFTETKVIVEAVRHNSPNPCIAVVAYPQLAVSMERKDLPVVFRIRDVRDDGGSTATCV